MLWYNEIQNIKEVLDKREQHKRTKLKGDYGRSELRAAPIMVPDAWFQACQICDKKFTTFKRRRHHCRICGKVVCGTCSTGKLPDAKGELVRACSVCMSEHKTNEQDTMDARTTPCEDIRASHRRTSKSPSP